MRFCSSAKTYPHLDGTLQTSMNHSANLLHRYAPLSLVHCFLVRCFLSCQGLAIAFIQITRSVQLPYQVYLPHKDVDHLSSTSWVLAPDYHISFLALPFHTLFLSHHSDSLGALTPHFFGLGYRIHAPLNKPHSLNHSLSSFMLLDVSDSSGPPLKPSSQRLAFRRSQQCEIPLPPTYAFSSWVLVPWASLPLPSFAL